MFVLALALQLVPAAPPAPDATAAMQLQLTDYFEGEKREAWFWLGAGTLGEASGTWLLARGGDLRGAAVPVMAVGLVQLGAAALLFWRTDRQIRDLTALVARDPRGYVEQEGARMRRVNRGFDVYKWVELAFVAGGAGMAVAGARDERTLLEGVGIRLVVQGLVMLVFDFFAERRARLYAEEIEAFAQSR